MGDVLRFPASRRRPEPTVRSSRSGARPPARSSARSATATSGRWPTSPQHAGISVQYLSEVERGRKEPSSEVLAAVAGALGLRMADLTLRVARRLHGPVCLAA